MKGWPPPASAHRLRSAGRLVRLARVASVNTEEQLLEAVGRVYDAVLAPDPAQVIGQVLHDAMGVDSWIGFVSHHRSGELLRMVAASGNFDAAARADYRAYYHARNLWYQNCTFRQPPYVALGEEIVDPTSFARSEFAADWCSRVGIYHMVGCFYPLDAERVVACGLHLPKGAGPFDEARKRRFALLMRHLAQAQQIAERLGALDGARHTGLEVIDGLGIGAILVDAGGRAVFANAVAERALRHSRWLTVRSGELRPVDTLLLARFRQAVHDAAQAAAGEGFGHGDLMRLHDPLDGELSVLVAPARAALTNDPAAPCGAIVLFPDPDADPAPLARDIAEVLRITPAEARLVAQLVRGRTLVQAASALQVSVNTAKAQLQSAFRKTGHTRQAELVSAVLTHPLLRLRGAHSAAP